MVHTEHEISTLFSLHPGQVVAIAGAGGKHTLMARMAEELASRDTRVVITSTTNLHCTAALSDLPMLKVGADGDWKKLLPQRLAKQKRVVLVSRPQAAALFRGISPGTVGRIIACVPDAVVLVKADGARKRLLKAPAPHEPNYPPKVDVSVLVLSLASIGRPLDETNVHRLKQVQQLTPSATITPQTLALVCGAYHRRLPSTHRHFLYLSCCLSQTNHNAGQWIFEQTNHLFDAQFAGDTIEGRFYCF